MNQCLQFCKIKSELFTLVKRVPLNPLSWGRGYGPPFSFPGAAADSQGASQRILAFYFCGVCAK